MIKKIKISEKETGERLDVFLAKNFTEYSRTYFSDLIKKGDVKVNGDKNKSSYRIDTNDEIIINFIEAPKTDLLPEDIKLDIIYEDKDVIVLNKQAGIVVHPAAGNSSGTLVNALISHFPEIREAVYDQKSEVSRIRPGLVHRLDKDTSGALIVAKNSRAMHSLSRQIQNRTVKKTYLALCFNWPNKASGELISHLGRHPKNRKLIAHIGPTKGKEAISSYEVLKYLSDNSENKYCLIEFNIKTGRTHQIRVQAADMGSPVMGDKAYGNKQSIKLSDNLGIERQLLHAKTLSITLPGNTKPSIFDAPLPQDMKEALSRLAEIKYER